jgi:hypothetical protein
VPDVFDEFLFNVGEDSEDGLGNLTLTLRVEEGQPRWFDGGLWGVHEGVWEGGVQGIVVGGAGSEGVTPAGLVSVARPRAGAPAGRLVGRERAEVAGWGMRRGDPRVWAKAPTEVDGWALGGWTLMMGGCAGASVRDCAPACAPGAGEGWREGGGYREYLEAAPASALVREREVLGAPRASCTLVETLWVRLDRRGAMVGRVRLKGVGCPRVVSNARWASDCLIG